MDACADCGHPIELRPIGATKAWRVCRPCGRVERPHVDRPRGSRARAWIEGDVLAIRIPASAWPPVLVMSGSVGALFAVLLACLVWASPPPWACWRGEVTESFSLSLLPPALIMTLTGAGLYRVHRALRVHSVIRLHRDVIEWTIWPEGRRAEEPAVPPDTIVWRHAGGWHVHVFGPIGDPHRQFASCEDFEWILGACYEYYAWPIPAR